MVPANPLTYIRNLWRGQGRAAVPFPENDETTVLDLPVEIRVVIWKYLSAKEQTALRQVCTTFHHDVTQFVGVYAELTGHRPWSQRCIFALRNPEPARFQENWDWITNSQVQSLRVRGLAGIPPDRDCSSLVRNRHSVRRLIIELDEIIRPNGKVPSLLSAFTNLRILNISWESASSFKPEPTVLEEYRQNAISLTREFLKRLVGRHTLRELCVEIDIPLGREHAVQTFLGEMDRPTTEQELDFPTRLEKLKLVFPVMQAVDRPEIPCWRALLDRQTQLRHLTFNLGFIYWSTFHDALFKNRHTLEELDLSLSNWSVRRNEENWDEIIQPEFHFNWRELLENAEHLKFLRVRMSARGGLIPEQTPNETLNFNELNLVRLERLELQSIHLTRDHFIKIFVELTSLKKVKLIHWNDPQLGNQAEVAMDSLAPVLVALLRRINLEEVELRDWCLLDCPKPVRKFFAAIPNYDVTFPLLWTWGNLSIFIEIGREIHCKPAMFIKRKSAHQLVPPIPI